MQSDLSRGSRESFRCNLRQGRPAGRQTERTLTNAWRLSFATAQMAGAMPAGALQFMAYESSKSHLNKMLANVTLGGMKPHIVEVFRLASCCHPVTASSGKSLPRACARAHTQLSSHPLRSPWRLQDVAWWSARMSRCKPRKSVYVSAHTRIHSQGGGER